MKYNCEYPTQKLVKLAGLQNVQIIQENITSATVHVLQHKPYYITLLQQQQKDGQYNVYRESLIFVDIGYAFTDISRMNIICYHDHRHGLTFSVDTLEVGGCSKFGMLDVTEILKHKVIHDINNQLQHIQNHRTENRSQDTHDKLHKFVHTVDVEQALLNWEHKDHVDFTIWLSEADNRVCTITRHQCIEWLTDTLKTINETIIAMASKHNDCKLVISGNVSRFKLITNIIKTIITNGETQILYGDQHQYQHSLGAAILSYTKFCKPQEIQYKSVCGYHLTIGVQKDKYQTLITQNDKLPFNQKYIINRTNSNAHCLCITLWDNSGGEKFLLYLSMTIVHAVKNIQNNNNYEVNIMVNNRNTTQINIKYIENLVANHIEKIEIKDDKCVSNAEPLNSDISNHRLWILYQKYNMIFENKHNILSYKQLQNILFVTTRQSNEHKAEKFLRNICEAINSTALSNTINT